MFLRQLTPVISTWLISNNAYFEVKIWSLPRHENLTTDKRYFGKEEKLLLRSNFLLFSPIFSITSRVQLHIYLLNVVVRIIFFLNSANLICRGTDIWKYFRESLGIRDYESWLYFESFYLKLLLSKNKKFRRFEFKTVNQVRSNGIRYGVTMAFYSAQIKYSFFPQLSSLIARLPNAYVKSRQRSFAW